LAPDRPEPEPQTVRGITIVPGRGGHVLVTRRLDRDPAAAVTEATA
ncbi:MAG: hypothetical protein H0V81_16235, partial [Solirubrobacterales bacterium]|nr:hypothetical protein [Solirubrobacterales bacterium]